MVLNNLPILVDCAGMYLLRNGLKAQIHHISPQTDPTTTFFRAKGAILRKGKMPEYSIWHVSGRFMALTESPLDIVSKI